jgi:hypothetical protein
MPYPTHFVKSYLFSPAIYSPLRSYGEVKSAERGCGIFTPATVILTIPKGLWP